jgi:hypothetical protein
MSAELIDTEGKKMANDTSKNHTEVMYEHPKRRALSQAAKVFVNQRIAEFCSDAEIIKNVFETFRLEIAPGNLHYYRYDSRALARWKTLREEHRRKWLADFSDVPLAQKKHRVKVLSNICARAIQENKLGEATRALEQIRREIEGEKVQVSGGVNFEHTTKTPDQIVEAMVEATVGRRVAHEEDGLTGDN